MNSVHRERSRCTRLAAEGQCKEANSIQIQARGRVIQSKPPNKRNCRNRVQPSPSPPYGLFIGSAKRRSRVDYPCHGAQCLRIWTSHSHWLDVNKALGFPQFVCEGTLKDTMSITHYDNNSNKTHIIFHPATKTTPVHKVQSLPPSLPTLVRIIAFTQRAGCRLVLHRFVNAQDIVVGATPSQRLHQVVQRRHERYI